MKKYKVKEAYAFDINMDLIAMLPNETFEVIKQNMQIGHFHRLSESIIQLYNVLDSWVSLNE